jgi:hypothetical protein
MAYHRSSAWTGRYRPLHIPHPRAVAWWLSVGLRKALCPHHLKGWSFICDICGLSMEEHVDHTWKQIPRKFWDRKRQRLYREVVI